MSQYHVSHIQSLKENGTYNQDNLTIMCNQCNTSLGSKNLNDYFKETGIIPSKRYIELNNWNENKVQIENEKKSNQLKINRWKQYLTHAKVNSLLIKLFPHSALIQSIVADSDYHCDDLVNKASFKELGINHKSLIDKMIELECLPFNFYAIK